MEHIGAVYYINLAHRVDRKEHFLREFAKLGADIPPVRIDAVRTDHGQLGCALSHCKTLEQFIASGAAACCVFEDDFTFRSADPAVNQGAMRAAFAGCPDWDVYMMAAGDYDFRTAPTAAPGVLRVLSAQTTSGYCISQKLAPALLENFRAAAADCAARGPCNDNAIDQSWKTLQPAHAWLVGAPRLGYQYGNYSDISKVVNDYDC